MFKSNTKYKIKTPSGFECFFGVQKKITYKIYKFSFYDETNIRCSANHIFLTNVGFLKSTDINKENHTISGKNISTIEMFDGEYEVFDLVEVDKHNCYYTGGVVSHNCEFLGSSNTLIDSRKLRTLSWKTPLRSFEHFDIYEDPIKDHKYVITVDTSRGVGIDYSAFVVFDVTDIPYKIVAKYRDNEISPLLYPNIIWRAGRHYNDAMVLVEVNDNGQQIADILFYDLEYEGVLLTQNRGKQGIKVGGGYKVKPIRGIKTTKQVKRIGCSNLKTLIEEDKLLFNDYHLIYELFRFIEHNATYQAEEGEHDDMVMCCVLFAWLAHQRYFRNKTDTDIRDNLYQENKEIIEDSITPFGFFDVNSVPQTKVSNPRDFYNIDIHPGNSYIDDEDNLFDRIISPSW